MGFDLQTHKRNRKGTVTSTNHYTLHIVNGVKKYERPKGSGVFYTEDGNIIEAKKSTWRTDLKPKAAAVDAKMSDSDKQALQALVGEELEK